MLNLFCNFEYTINGYSTQMLDILSILAVVSAISVITVKNPIVSVLFLIGLFFSIASYLISIGYTFIGLSYLLVYVGAVSILFLFILMLINVRISELYTDTNNSLPLVVFISISLVTIIADILPKKLGFNYLTLGLVNSISNIYENNDTTINHVTLTNWDNNLIEYTHIAVIGNELYGSFAILLILASIILLLAMVGAIVITVNNNTDN